jgi:hypothetical protein
VKPASLTAYAGLRIFGETGEIEDVARGLGLRSLDRAADLVGHDWAQQTLEQQAADARGSFRGCAPASAADAPQTALLREGSPHSARAPYRLRPQHGPLRACGDTSASRPHRKAAGLPRRGIPLFPGGPKRLRLRPPHGSPPQRPRGLVSLEGGSARGTRSRGRLLPSRCGADQVRSGCTHSGVYGSIQTSCGGGIGYSLSSKRWLRASSRKTKRDPGATLSVTNSSPRMERS